MRFGEHPKNKKRLAAVKVTGTVERTQIGVGGRIGGSTQSDNVVITAKAEIVNK